LDGLTYNTSRGDIAIPEYGRNIKNMIEYAVSVADKEERQKIADAIISVMGQLNPHLRDVDDYRHKLWDHLFIISDFQLDVESPYPIPKKGEMVEKPELLTYSKGKRKIRYAYYGNSINLFIKEAIKKEGEEKKFLTISIANLMKKLFLTYNKEYVDDDVIFKHLDELSNGELSLEKDFKLVSVEELSKSIDRKTLTKNNKKNNSKKNNNGKKHHNNQHKKRKY